VRNFHSPKTLPCPQRVPLPKKKNETSGKKRLSLKLENKSASPRKSKTPVLGDTRKATSAFFPKIGLKKSKKPNSSTENISSNSDQSRNKHLRKHKRNYSGSDSTTFRSVNYTLKENRLSLDAQRLLNEGLDAERRLEEMIDMIHADGSDLRDTRVGLGVLERSCGSTGESTMGESTDRSSTRSGRSTERSSTRSTGESTMGESTDRSSTRSTGESTRKSTERSSTRSTGESTMGESTDRSSTRSESTMGESTERSKEDLELDYMLRSMQI